MPTNHRTELVVTPDQIRSDDLLVQPWDGKATYVIFDPFFDPQHGTWEVTITEALPAPRYGNTVAYAFRPDQKLRIRRRERT